MLRSDIHRSCIRSRLNYSFNIQYSISHPEIRTITHYDYKLLKHYIPQMEEKC